MARPSLCVRPGPLSLAVAFILPLTGAFAMTGCGQDASVEPSIQLDSATDPDSTTTLDTEDTAVELDSTVTPDAADATDATDTTDAIDTADTADTAGCPGGPTCPCKADAECSTGKCLQTADGSQCAQSCPDGTCPKGSTCQANGDGPKLCVPQHVSLCAPCQQHKDCQVQDAAARCVSYGDAGSFCASGCADDQGCPDGYGCVDVTDSTDNAKTKQCKLKQAPGNDPAVCPCSPWAKASGLSTNCAVTSPAGTCKASRACSEAGLGACTAKTPQAELCNGQDDNCDGQTDNLGAETKCSQKAFLPGSGGACSKKEDCPGAEACEAGTCQTLIGECFGTPSCGADGKVVCSNAATPQVESCDGKDQDCDGLTDEDFTWKSPIDGAALAVGQKCGAGPCAGGTVACIDAGTAKCTTAGKATVEICNGEDDDCNNKTDDKACDDGNACTNDVCNPIDGSCKSTPFQGACDDANACTSGDVCTTGSCVGQAKSCDDGNPCTTDACDVLTAECQNKAYAGSCTDGNPCTVGDACAIDPQTNKSICVAGIAPLACDDSNICTNDTCDSAIGCVSKPNAATAPCYTGPDKTVSVGICKPGIRLCVAGALSDACKDETLPGLEGCDGIDNDCDGPVDEGCKPTSVAVTFSNAQVSGKSGNNLQMQLLVGATGPSGVAKGSGKYSIDFGFMAWLVSLMAGGK
jgi:hypothetical protein